MLCPCGQELKDPEERMEIANGWEDEGLHVRMKKPEQRKAQKKRECLVV